MASSNVTWLDDRARAQADRSMFADDDYDNTEVKRHRDGNAIDSEIADAANAINGRVVENLLSRTTSQQQQQQQQVNRNWISLSEAASEAVTRGQAVPDGRNDWLTVGDMNLDNEASVPCPTLSSSPPRRFAGVNRECDNNNSDDGGPTALELLEANSPWFRKEATDDTDIVRSLGQVLDAVNMDRLWNANAFQTTLGALMASLVRLFVTPYERPEEQATVRMLREVMFRGAVAAGESGATRGKATNDFWDVYRSRAAFLIGWTKYRRHIERMESKQYVTRKQKVDLNTLYVLLSSADVRVHRATVDDNAVSFVDPLSGYELQTPPLLNRPLVVEMKSQDMFGNISKNARLLDRSLNAAANNAARRKRETASAEEILTLLQTSVPLAIDEPGTGDDYDDDGDHDYYEQQNAIPSGGPRDTEDVLLRHMLTDTMIVSMMAEEFRVFASDSPPGTVATAGSDARTRGSGAGDTEETEDPLRALPKSSRFRRPVFYNFVGKLSK